MAPDFLRNILPRKELGRFEPCGIMAVYACRLPMSAAVIIRAPAP